METYRGKDKEPYDNKWFMNPERVSMPDIDSDFCYERRSEVIDYTVHKYGADKVAQIMTFGTIGARMAIRDTGAVLEINSQLVDKVAKLIPQAPKVTIDKALTEGNQLFSPDLFDLYNNDSETKRLIDTAKTIEGLIRQTGIHAAGVLISDVPLVELGALMEQEDSDIPVFMGDMVAVDYLKLIKFDFLGLRTLTVESKAIELIKKNKGIDLTDVINSSEVLEDKETYNLISSGKSFGVFQLESPGMQSFMSELQPKSIEDIIIGISMFRPGPLEKIPQLIANKRNPENIKYQEDAKHILKPILDKTYGIIVYQEQCMALVRELAGYSFGRSDNLRRAMSKKKTAEMNYERQIFIYGAAKCPHCGGKGKIENGDKCTVCDGRGEIVAKDTEKDIFIQGCIRNGISLETANQLYDDMEEFAKYAFNKSHATAYGELTVHTAYLVTHYPVEYYTAYLNSIISNQDKVRHYMAIVKKLGINISRPDINKCSNIFTCDDKNIYMGLSSLKFVGIGVSSAIEEREKNGEFTSLQDLLTRVTLSKREVESLIKAGAFDSFGIAKRSQMLDKVEDILKLTKNDRLKKESGQVSLFDICDDASVQEANIIKFADIQEFNQMKIFAMEKEVSGFYLSGHPLELPEYKDVSEKSTITTVDEFTNKDNRKKVKLVGIVNINEDEKEGIRISKSGNAYANFTLEDQYGTIKVLAFKDAVDQCRNAMYKDAIVQVTGNLSVDIEQYEDDNGEIKERRDIKIFLETITRVKSACDRKKVFIQVNTRDAYKMNTIKSVLNKYPGSDTVIFYDPILKQSFKSNTTIDYGINFLYELQSRTNLGDKDIVSKNLA